MPGWLQAASFALQPSWRAFPGVGPAATYPVLIHHTCRSEGVPRTGLFHPWARWDRGLGGSENSVSSSCRATAGAFPENGCISIYRARPRPIGVRGRGKCVNMSKYLQICVNMCVNMCKICVYLCKYLSICVNLCKFV